MRVRILSGNYAGTIADIPQAAAEVDLLTGFVELAPEEPVRRRDRDVDEDEPDRKRQRDRDEPDEREPERERERDIEEDDEEPARPGRTSTSRATSKHKSGR
jgi:hypothetical protein